MPSCAGPQTPRGPSSVLRVSSAAPLKVGVAHGAALPSLSCHAQFPSEGNPGVRSTDLYKVQILGGPGVEEKGVSTVGTRHRTKPGRGNRKGPRTSNRHVPYLNPQAVMAVPPDKLRLSWMASPHSHGVTVSSE